MKTYIVTVRFAGEGYATRTFRITAASAEAAEKVAYESYVSRISTSSVEE